MSDAKILDPSGHEWLVATRVETISPDEMRSRFAKLVAGDVDADVRTQTDGGGA